MDSVAATTPTDETTIKIKLEGEGSVSDLLREAANILDGLEDA